MTNSDKLKIPLSKEDFTDATFTAKVVRVSLKEGKAEYGGKTQVELELEPTSYEGKNRFEWFNISERKNSLWFKFLDALDSCGVQLKDVDDIEGHEFEWSRQDISFGINRETGEETVAKDKLLPVKLIGKPSAGKPVKAKAGEVSSPKDFVLSLVEGEPVPVNTIYDEGKKAGYKKPDLFKAVKDLEREGKAILEDGVVSSVPE